MRQVRPSTNGHASSSYSTSSLLKEISSLRLRLREIEEDTQSSISANMSVAERENQLANMLRNQVAKVEHEKATLEKDYMNQISSLARENQYIISDLQDKLKKAEDEKATLKERLSATSTSDEVERLARRLEGEREAHAEEMEQMKKTIAHSDDEIAENRREMDYLHEQLIKLQTHKDELLQEVTETRNNLENERRKSETYRVELNDAKQHLTKLNEEIGEKEAAANRKHEEMGEMNDHIIDLEQQKDMLVVENTDLRLVIQKKEDSISELKARNHEMNKQREQERNKFSSSGPGLTVDVSISPSEKEKLEGDVTRLEERLQRFQSKILEKDKTIDNLAASLSEARRANKNLRAEVKALQSGSPVKSDSVDTTVTNEKTVSSDAKENLFELEMVRKQNKALNDEIKALRQKEQEASDDAKDSASELESLRQQNKALNDQVKALQQKAKEASKDGKGNTSELELLRKQNKALKDELKALRQKTGDSSKDSPSLKRSIGPAFQSEESDKSAATRSPPTQQKGRLPPIPPLSPPELSRRMRTNSIRTPSTPVSGIVASFEKRISGSTQKESRSEDEHNSLAPESGETREAEHEREAVIALEEKLRAEKEMVKELRSQLAVAAAASSTPASSNIIEKKLRESQREVDRLRSLVDEYEGSFAKLQEKINIQRDELDQACDERNRIQLLLADRDKENKRLKKELTYSSNLASKQDEKKEDDSEEELVRLRAQVAALQPELDRTLTEIEKLQCETERLKKALRTEQNASLVAEQKLEAFEATQKKDAEDNVSSKNQRKHDAEINQLKIELTKTQVSKADLEMEYMTKLKEVEDEIEALEIEAEEELEEKQKEIEYLQTTLAKKEAAIARLEQEREQLCTSMNSVSSSRKDEWDDLQAELIDLTARTTSQAREIQLQKSKIEEHEASKQEIEKRYQDRVAEMEEEIYKMKKAARHQSQSEEVNQLKAENLRLRDAIREAKVERRALMDRLGSMTSDKSSSKSAQVLRDRNAALKEEVERLTHRLKKMEASITRFAI